MEKIYLGSDHAGFDLKDKIKEYLKEKNLKFEDLGNTVFDKSDDYPDFGYKVAKKVAKTNSKGILVCGSSFGICMVANKVKGIRAASVVNAQDARQTREHNDANIICLSGWDQDKEEITKIIDAFLNTQFASEERHVRRVEKIREIEERELK